jgi:hypothetical protein
VIESKECTRRDFLVFGSVGSLLAPVVHLFPWWKPKDIVLADGRFEILRGKHPKRHYILLHGDETTARDVLTKHMETHPGVAFLTESKTRTIPIDSGQVDPNRVFSRNGAAISLQKNNPNWNARQIQDALDLIESQRDHFLNEIMPHHGELLVALHNNAEDYSVNSETAISDLRSLKQPDNPHAFFLCTDPGDFQILATSPYNVVLQQHVRAPDDGSLSRRAAARLARYVNLEVAQGDAARQQEMLTWLEQHLPFVA